ncbi:hypothetical protein ACIQ9Q_38965 [Streptomyces sp. NPDC094438]|uniref:hypothetical protein n=1 Tax=Streptomyces sp. NPDC094438 TaxID=3366061 RepID=UPI003817452C
MGHRESSLHADRRIFLTKAFGVTVGLVTAAATIDARVAVADQASSTSSKQAVASAAGQDNWRFCVKCYVMFYYGYPDNGRCAAGADHSMAGYNFDIPYDIPETPNAQANWRFCTRCYTMYFFGYPSGGWCPVGGSHNAAGFNFVLPHDIVETPNAQAYWRFCTNCFALFFWGYPEKGRCPAGGGHNAAGFDFVIPHS